MSEKKYKYEPKDRDYFFSRFKDFINEHELTPGDKNEAAYYFKTVQSLSTVVNDLINNYGKTDNINQLDKAMSKLDDIIDESKKWKQSIKKLADEHYKK